MQGGTHTAAAIMIVAATDPANPVTMGACVIGALLPGIDHSKSTISKIIPFVHKLFKQRGVTHSLLAGIMAFIINPWLGIGYFSHIILDMLTIKGVRLLYPIRKMYGMKAVKSKGCIDYLLRAIFVAGSFCLFFLK